MSENSEVRYPDIQVELTGQNGNALVLISAVSRALRRGGVSNSEISEFATEAMSGDYDNVLRTCMRWVNVS